MGLLSLFTPSGIKETILSGFGKRTKEEKGRAISRLATTVLTPISSLLVPQIGLFKTGLLVVGSLIGGSVLAESPKAREKLASAVGGFDPGALGTGIAKAIEGKKAFPSIKTGLVSAGLLGGAIIAVPKIIGALKGDKKPKAIIAEKPITPQTQIIQTEPTPVGVTPKPNGKAINITVNVSQRQTKRIKNIVVFQ